jgi:choline dehydrogenase-like flavoprotein
VVLPHLFAGEHQTTLQHTSLSVDAVGRHVCSTWHEATASGGPPFTTVVVGAGMYGAYFAAKLARRHPEARILVLDAGPFLVAEHLQNLGRIGLDVPDPIRPDDDPGVARSAVWGLPWRGNVDFPGLAYCSGGKSLYWGGWCPRLTADDLARWPSDVAAALPDLYTLVESDTGVQPGTDFLTGELLSALTDACVTAAPTIPGIETTIGSSGVEGAPLAVQGSSPASGLFSFDKYSSLPLLVDAIRDDIQASTFDDAKRRLFLVPRAHVVRAHVRALTGGDERPPGGGHGDEDGVPAAGEARGAIHALEVDVAGVRQLLPIAPECAVVLAASAIESTRLALDSFPSPRMGRNLMGHTRSDFTVRIDRDAFPPISPRVQTAALLVRGGVDAGRFHIQVTASNSRDGSDSLLFRMVPDMDLLEAQLANTDARWLTITLRAIGEMHGDRLAPVHGADASWMDLSPYEVDEYGAPRAYVHLTLGSDDWAVWQAMDEACIHLAQQLAGTPERIQYRYDDAWQTRPPPLDRAFPEWHRGLGTTYHESGTLWMGGDPATSVTDTRGRFHRVSNAYACDQSLFPTVGSVNPVLTGLALARRLADHLAPQLAG